MINQFRSLCPSLSYSPPSKDGSDATYSSIYYWDPEENDCDVLYAVSVQTDQTEDEENEEKDDHIFKIDTHIDHYCFCKAKKAHDSVLGKIDASLKKNLLITLQDTHLDAKALIAKQDDNAEKVDLTALLY